MRNLIFFPLLLILFSITSCGSKEFSVKELSMANSIVEEQPDTALFALQRIAEPENMNAGEYALYCLLHTQAHNIANKKHTNDALINVAVSYFKDTDDWVMKSKSYYYLARVNEDLNEDEYAEENYLIALSAIEKTREYKDTALIYSRLSELYLRNGRYEEAFEAQNKSYTNTLLATNNEAAFPWYTVILLLVLTGTFSAVVHRYRVLYTNSKKMVATYVNKMSATQETVVYQKAEINSLKKELGLVKQTFYNSSEIVRKIRSINNIKIGAKEKPALTEEQWNNYLNLLEETYGFVSRLKQNYPRLTDIDIRICSLLREGIITAHISSVMNMIPDTLARRIQRIKSEKMNKGDSAKTLEMIIRNF